MNTIELLIPSKTFLAGEYLALQGGAALVACTEPVFRIRIKPLAQPVAQNPFHPMSPAGRFWYLHEAFFRNYEVEMNDPHQGKGGFGASTAEFIGLHVLYQQRESLWTDAEMNYDIQQVYKEYRRLCKEQGLEPSGADLIAQMVGGLTLFERDSGKIQSFSWPFSDIGFYLVRTQNKIKTHEHLAQKPEFNSTLARPAMNLIYSGLSNIDSADFLRGLKIFSVELSRLDLVAPATREILARLQKWPVKVVKGCGALGADVILAVFDTKDQDVIRQALQQENLEIVADHQHLSIGLTKTHQQRRVEVES